MIKEKRAIILIITFFTLISILCVSKAETPEENPSFFCVQMIDGTLFKDDLSPPEPSVLIPFEFKIINQITCQQLIEQGLKVITTKDQLKDYLNNLPAETKIKDILIYENVFEEEIKIENIPFTKRVIYERHNTQLNNIYKLLTKYLKEKKWDFRYENSISKFSYISLKVNLDQTHLTQIYNLKIKPEAEEIDLGKILFTPPTNSETLIGYIILENDGFYDKFLLDFPDLMDFTLKNVQVSGNKVNIPYHQVKNANIQSHFVNEQTGNRIDNIKIQAEGIPVANQINIYYYLSDNLVLLPDEKGIVDASYSNALQREEVNLTSGNLVYIPQEILFHGAQKIFFANNQLKDISMQKDASFSYMITGGYINSIKATKSFPLIFHNYASPDSIFIFDTNWKFTFNKPNYNNFDKTYPNGLTFKYNGYEITIGPRTASYNNQQATNFVLIPKNSIYPEAKIQGHAAVKNKIGEEDKIFGIEIYQGQSSEYKDFERKITYSLTEEKRIQTIIFAAESLKTLLIQNKELPSVETPSEIDAKVKEVQIKESNIKMIDAEEYSESCSDAIVPGNERIKEYTDFKCITFSEKINSDASYAVKSLEGIHTFIQFSGKDNKAYGCIVSQTCGKSQNEWCCSGGKEVRCCDYVPPLKTTETGPGEKGSDEIRSPNSIEQPPVQKIDDPIEYKKSQDELRRELEGLTAIQLKERLLEEGISIDQIPESARRPFGGGNFKEEAINLLMKKQFPDYETPKEKARRELRGAKDKFNKLVLDYKRDYPTITFTPEKRLYYSGDKTGYTTLKTNLFGKEIELAPIYTYPGLDENGPFGGNVVAANANKESIIKYKLDGKELIFYYPTIPTIDKTFDKLQQKILRENIMILDNSNKDLRNLLLGKTNSPVTLSIHYVNY